MKNKKRILVLGCNFAGLTIARYLHRDAGDHVTITVIDRKNYIKVGFDKFNGKIF